MDDKLDELLSKHSLFVLLGKQKNAHIRSETDIELSEKIQYRVDAKDWLIYIDGNTFRKFVRGIALCSSGVAFCDDNGQVCKITIEELKKSNISNTGKSLLINGKSITIGEACKVLSEKLILIRKDLNVNNQRKTSVKVANLTEELWYIGYEGEVTGPYSKEELKVKISSEEYIVNAMQVWTASYVEWRLVEEISEFADLFKKKNVKRVIKESKLIDINHCTKDELMRIPGMIETQADAFIRKRDTGILLKNVYELQEMFGLKPHEAEMIKNIVVFRVDSIIEKKGRILDI